MSSPYTDRIHQTQQAPFFKQHYGWKLAFLQHPMYLLIDEDRGDPIVGERVAPWGAPDVEAYIERVRRNLASLEAFPALRLNYEFSAVEMEEMCHRFPDVWQKMKELLARHALDIVDGTYSQAHLQLYGSETTWRQFAEGIRVIRELFDYHPRVYITQETGQHQQLPQILKRFGFDYFATPCFPWALDIVEGPFSLNGQWLGIDTQCGDEFVQGVALDGTTIPAYVAAHRWTAPDAIVAEQINKDMYMPSPLWINTPDLEEVNAPEYHLWMRFADFCLLAEELDKRYARCGARAKARIYTPWSYCEGVWADELLRENKQSEEMGVLADGIRAMALREGISSDATQVEQYWRTLLKYQHHDVNWHEVTDLRQKAIELYRRDRREMHGFLQALCKQFIPSGNAPCFVNVRPVARTALIATKTEVEGFQRHGDECIGMVALPAGGYRCMPAGTASSSVVVDQPAEIVADGYRVALSEGGLMRTLVTAKGETLFADAAFEGGELRCLLGDTYVNNRQAKVTCYDGPQAFIVERASRLGHIPVAERYDYFKHANLIRVRLTFDFQGDEVGYFYTDESKICLYYPTAATLAVQDIPFGFVTSMPERILYAPNWVRVGGLTLINRGNCKYFLKNGAITNMLAWGGTEFTNRQHIGWSNRTEYDLRLYGQQTIEYYVMPDADLSDTEVAQRVDEWIFPTLETTGTGEKSLYATTEKGALTSDVFVQDGMLWERGYQLPDVLGARHRDFEIYNQPLTEG